MTNDVPDPQDPPSGDFVGRIETELLRTRKVLIFGEINDKLARDVCSRLLLLADRDVGEPIDVYINSPGGHVESGDTLVSIRIVVMGRCVMPFLDLQERIVHGRKIARDNQRSFSLRNPPVEAAPARCCRCDRVNQHASRRRRN